MELERFFGFLHPALVHFPLVLLLASVGLEAIGFFRREPRYAWAAQAALLVGVATMLVAFVAGNFAELWAARQGVPQDPMESHELLATLTSWGCVFLAAWRFALGRNAKRRLLALYLALTAAACGLLIVTGHQGAMLVYERGAAVAASAPPPVPSHEDLRQLTLRQGADEIFYSEKMHHIFGWMTLLLGVLLIVDAVSPQAGERLRKVGQILLLCGGAYLMIFSDTDSWPLSHLRPVTDKEVLVHKTYAILLLVGLRGVWRRRGDAPPSRQLQNRTMAIFALVGGALLFTHVHSGAAYANVAVGVYVHHTVMGFVALAIGGVKLLDDALTDRSALRRFGFRWAYPALMLLEACLLINYNEGLPWFVGYGDIAVSTPHNGLLAHFGPNRAELVFDRSSGRVDVYILDRSRDSSHPIAARELTGIARVGMETTLIPLAAAPSPSQRATHFTGQAAFLRDVPLFQFRASANGATADFEPVVDASKTLTRAANAAYLCPMHPEIGSGAAGLCSICGMNLVPNKMPRPASALHDADYSMSLNTAQGRSETTPQPGRPTRLTLTLRRADSRVVRDFAVVHTKKLHLIIVSRDLTFFDHVHPQLQNDGAFTLDYTFPAPGEYLLYADLTPAADRNQVFRLPVTVAGDPPPAPPLAPTPAQARLFGAYRVALAVSPAPPQSRDETFLTLTISENGVPVTDLQPFLGAGGHCVILREDGANYLHSHPAERPADRFGPALTFHTVFPRPGRYKIWGQFLRRGQPLTADFVVDVR